MELKNTCASACSYLWVVTVVMEIIGVGSVWAPLAGLLEHVLGFDRHPRLALGHSTLGRSGTPPTHRRKREQFTDQTAVYNENVMRCCHLRSVAHMLPRLSGWVTERPFRPSWPSVPPPSGGGSMRLNINGVRFCVRDTTRPAGWHQGWSQDANTGCSRSMFPHGGAISKNMAVGLQGKVC